MPSSICRHIRINGDRCGSPSLRYKPFCYFHDRAYQRHQSMLPATAIPTVIQHHDGNQLTPIEVEYYTPVEGPLKLDLPPLEDRESIQLAVSMIVTAMAQNRLEPARATRILYGLQVASSNVGKLQLEPSRAVTEPVLDESGHDLAPDEDPEPDHEPDPANSVLTRLLQQLDADEAAKAAAAKPEPEPEPA
jgi:hypothetical protein